MTLYEIKNSKNLRVYIGITVRNPKDRWYEHKYSLKNNTHHNRHLQAAWNLYGEENLKFSILGVYPSVNELKKAEEASIIKAGDMVYNMSVDSVAFYHSSEARRKIVEAQLKPVIGMRVVDGLVREFGSIKDASHVANSKSIGACCKMSGGRISCDGWVWMYIEDYQKNPSELGARRELGKKSKARIFSKEHRMKKSLEMKCKYTAGWRPERINNVPFWPAKTSLFINNNKIMKFCSGMELKRALGGVYGTILAKLSHKKNPRFLDGFLIYEHLLSDKNLLSSTVERLGLDLEKIETLLSNRE
jgi:hypothetical protein